jgi:hypothetical protein
MEHVSNRYTMYLLSNNGQPLPFRQCPSIPIYLTFAITSIKAQSKTLPKTILSLPSDAQIKFMKPRVDIHDFNINISRGSGNIDNVRLLLPAGASHNDSIQNLVKSFVPTSCNPRVKQFNEDLYIELLKQSENKWCT